MFFSWFHRSPLPGNKLLEANGVCLPASFPSFSLLPSAISANYTQENKSILDYQSPLQAQLLNKNENIKHNLLPVPDIPAKVSRNSSPISAATGEIDNNINSQNSTDKAGKQSTNSTKLDSALSFGMARLLGEAKKNCKGSKPFFFTSNF